MLGKSTIVGAFLTLLFLCFGVMRATALEGIVLSPDVKVLDITDRVEYLDHVGDQVHVTTALGSDGLVRRIVVRADEQNVGGDKAHWAVFALSNKSSSPIERLLVANHYRFWNSGILRSDLDMSRIVAITPSQGAVLKRLSARGADLFVISLAPDEVVTFVAELRRPHLLNLRLWEKAAYDDRLKDIRFFQGSLIGIFAIIALLLTILVIVRWSPIFPAAASFVWAILAYLFIDFGFWSYIFFGAEGETSPLHRAVAEAMFPITLLMFLFTSLRLYRDKRYLLSFWIFWVFLSSFLLALAFYDPSISVGIARITCFTLALAGFCTILYFALRRYERVIVLLPAWGALLLWLIVAGNIALGGWDDDFASFILPSSLTIVVLVIAFTAMEHAFSGSVTVITQETDTGRRALALSGSGDSVWDWAVDRESVFTGAEIEKALGYKEGGLSCSIRKWVSCIYFLDQVPFASMLQATVHQRGGRINTDVRILRADGHYSWLRLKARPVIGAEGKIVRCIGTLSDVTNERTAQERLLHDAVYDSLTGLPGKKLFLDRLDVAVKLSSAGYTNFPVLFFLDIDRFHDINGTYGRATGDSVLLTVARRLSRLLSPEDTLCRLFRDRFCILLVSNPDPRSIVDLSRKVQSAIKMPIALSGINIRLSANIGISVSSGEHRSGEMLMMEAEVAMYNARKSGLDKVELFNPDAAADFRMNRPSVLESELRSAIDKHEIGFLYNPIVNLQSLSIEGFDLSLLWNHPRLGQIGWKELSRVIGDSERIRDLALFATNTAALQLRDWQGIRGKGEDIFVSISVPGGTFLHYGFINDLKYILSQMGISPKSLKFGISETDFARNVEHAVHVAGMFSEMGIRLILDDFGTGYFALEYLKQCHFEIVRLNEIFVRADVFGHRSPIADAVVTMMNSLGIQTIVRGLESQDDVDVFSSIGCMFGQGGLFGELLTAQQVRKKLSTLASSSRRAR